MARFTPEEARQLLARCTLAPSSVHGVADLGNAPQTRQNAPGSLNAVQRVIRQATPGQDALYVACVARYGDRVIRDYRGAVPGRRWEIDVAVPSCRLDIEIDGWSHHGKSKSSWYRDLEKDMRLLQSGWLVLRVSNKWAVDDPERCVALLADIARVWGRAL